MRQPFLAVRFRSGEAVKNSLWTDICCPTVMQESLFRCAFRKLLQGERNPNAMQARLKRKSKGRRMLYNELVTVCYSMLYRVIISNRFSLFRWAKVPPASQNRSVAICRFRSYGVRRSFLYAPKLVALWCKNTSKMRLCKTCLHTKYAFSHRKSIPYSGFSYFCVD